ncbi:Ferric reduction oxidase 5 [Nymphaea thermarum]|nr:Ferric reduction oxidase 5 [Nymphaea thermarum]
MLDLLLSVSPSATKISSLELQVEAYVTREKEPQTAQIEAHTICIVLVSTVAMISIRRKGAKEGGQIQNLEMQTPTGTPRQLTYKAEKELESFPHQSVVQSTNVQYTYGARPGFRRESDVGVMVCGSKEMKEDVAGICSPANANNLHFHCVSFDF